MQQIVSTLRQEIVLKDQEIERLRQLQLEAVVAAAGGRHANVPGHATYLSQSNALFADVASLLSDTPAASERLFRPSSLACFRPSPERYLLVLEQTAARREQLLPRPWRALYRQTGCGAKRDLLARCLMVCPTTSK